MSWLALRASIVNAGCAVVCLAGLSSACTTTTTEVVPPDPNATGDDGSGAQTPPAPPAQPPAPPPSHPTAGKCTTSRPADALPTMPAGTGFFATHPLPQLLDAGGSVISSPRIVPIFFKGDALETDIETFLGSVGCTDYWRTAVGEYKVGDALAAPSVVLDQSAPTSTDDQTIEQFLGGLISSKKVEAPTPNTIYTIIYPEGTSITMQGGQSCQQFGGYHGDIQTPGGSPVAYAVIPRCKNFAGLSGINMVTAAGSHELVEAATDPFVHESPAYSQLDEQHYAFMLVLGAETGDLCAQEQNAFYKPNGYPFYVQRIWSNRNAHGGKNPCIPAASDPFLTAAPKLADTVDFFGATTTGVKVPAGTSKTIDVDIYSENGEIVTVDVMDATSATGMSGVSTYALDKSTGKSGDTVHLTITSPMGASQTEMFLLLVSGGGNQRVAWVGAVGH